MTYRDYMTQFVFIDEAKPALTGRMKQRVRQLRAAEEGTERARRAAPEAAPSKKNTLRRHPVRWTAIFASVALVAVVTPLLAVFIPRIHIVNSIKLEYMENLMVDNEGVTAYSIRREAGPAASPASAGRDMGPAVSLLSGQIVEDRGVQPLDKSDREYNYLYSTTESYEAGNVEYDVASVAKVTFMKNREVTEDVYDNNGELIDSDRRIAQEELDAQINRLYTTERFTFIQYVAKVEKSGYYDYRDANGKRSSEYVDIRPDGLEYDENGATSFDAERVQYEDRITGGNPMYYTSALSASFVIDNSTGYIYKIEGLNISGFVNGLAVGIDVTSAVSSVYTLSVDGDNNLIFTDVMPNKDVFIQEAFWARDGWAYICNSVIEGIDRDKKLFYTEPGGYVQAEGNVYRLGTLSVGNYRTIAHQMVEGVPVPYENHGLLKLHWDDREWAEYYNKFLGMYENLSIFDGSGSAYVRDGSVLACGEGLETGLVSEAEAEWFDDEFDMLLGEIGGKLSYCPVDLAECVGKLVTVMSDDFIPLGDFELESVDNYYLHVGNDSYKVDHVYRHRGMNETKYYRVVRTETGLGLEELTSKSYEQNVFIFQPINK